MIKKRYKASLKVNQERQSTSSRFTPNQPRLPLYRESASSCHSLDLMYLSLSYLDKYKYSFRYTWNNERRIVYCMIAGKRMMIRIESGSMVVLDRSCDLKLKGYRTHNNNLYMYLKRSICKMKIYHLRGNDEMSTKLSLSFFSVY